MTTQQMRTALTEIYPGNKWKLRVTLMPENQVIAIYNNLRKTGGLYKRKHIRKNEPGVRKAVQLSMFDPDYLPNGA